MAEATRQAWMEEALVELRRGQQQLKDSMCECRESIQNLSEMVGRILPRAGGNANIQGLKIEIPHFDGSDAEDWAFKIQELFQVYEIPIDQRIKLASLHMTGPAYAWYKWVMKYQMVTTWDEFLNALLLRFEATLYEDPKVALKELRQTDTVAEYQAKFEELSTKVTGLSESWLISFFIGGLQEQLKSELLLSQPQTYFQAVSLAKLHEQKYKSIEKDFRPPCTKSAAAPISKSTFSSHVPSTQYVVTKVASATQTPKNNNTASQIVNQSTPAASATNSATMRYVGRLFVKGTGKPSEILRKLNETAVYDPEEEIALYELEDGDIICFQKAPLVDNDEHIGHPNVPSSLEYVRNRQVVHFRSLDKPKEDDFCLEMSRHCTYDDVVERVAQQLGLEDPSKIRLTPHNCYTQQPKPQPIEYRGVEHLSDMLVHDNQISDILYYEVLDIPLPELQGLKTLKVAFHHAEDEITTCHRLTADAISLLTDERLKKEQAEKKPKKKKKAKGHLYTIIKVTRDEDLAEQIGKDIYFDLVDHDKEEVAKEFGIPVQFQRFWLWAKRRNHTYRPYRPLTSMEETQSVGQLREVSNKAHNAELNLFLEVEMGLDLRPIAPPEKTEDDILLFFKLYDPEKEELRFVGRLFVKGTGKPSEILRKLNEMAVYDPEEEIALYEEIKFEPCVMCEPIDKKLTFRASQLEDGDIICFQKASLIDGYEHVRYPDVSSYLEYVHSHQVVHFRSLDKPEEDDFCLEMSRLYTYDDVVERVAQQLGLEDSSKIRLTPHNCYSQQPKPHPIKYRGVEHLSDMLVHYNQTSDILYYEVLDIPLPELQGLKTLKVAFHLATKDEAVIHTIRLPKQSTVGDVLDDLKAKVELSHPNAELRLLEVFYHKIYKVFPPNEKIENINDQYWTLRAEEIPEEEKNLAPHDRLIHVYHFNKDTAQNQMQIQNFGDPFFLVIRECETLAEIKVRIQKKLQVSDEEFAKWKFAFLSLGRPEYLQDSDIVSSRFQGRDVYGAWEQYLGLEHTDNAPKRYAVSQSRHTFEKPVKIYN